VIDAYRRAGVLEGRCLCGSVTIRVDGPYIAAVGACHCGMCQRWHGMIHGSFDAEAQAVTVAGDVVRYASSSFSERAFCRICGSHLWMRNTDKPDENYEFMPGLFPAAAAFPLISEIYTDRAPAYLRLAGDHRRATGAEYESTHPFVEGDTP
jgi:hypothetical protein